jgi:hypothetical protein
MTKYLLSFILLSVCVLACRRKEESKTITAGIQFPYAARYATDFNDNVSDSDLLLVLNSYRFWEIGDLKRLRTTMGNSIFVNGSDGFKFRGLTDSLMNIWIKRRDSLSSVTIYMDVWRKSHSLKDSIDLIDVWYKEIDKYKTGRIDSANFEDDNRIRNGKIQWHSSHKQKL